MPPPRKSPDIAVPKKPATYSDTLSNIISEAVIASHAAPEEFSRYNNPTKSPGDLIKSLEDQKTIIENKPTTVWGIQTLHLLQGQYAGLEYKIPFDSLSTGLAFALGPLIFAWLGTL